MISLREIANEIIRLIGDLHIKAQYFQQIIYQILSLIEIMTHTAIIQLYCLHHVTSPNAFV